MKLKLASVFLSLIGSSPATAELGLGFGTGIRSLELGLMLQNARIQEARATVATLEGYYLPGDFPLGLSVSFEYQSYAINRSQHYFDQLSVTEVQPAVIFLPPGGKTRPMVRLGYTALGHAIATSSYETITPIDGIALEQKTQSIWKMHVNGFHVAVGTQIQFDKTALLSLALDFGQTQAQIQKIEVDSQDRTKELKAQGLRDFRMKSTALLIGGEIAY